MIVLTNFWLFWAIFPITQTKNKSVKGQLKTISNEKVEEQALKLNITMETKGSLYIPKPMNFLKISERPLTPPPPPLFWKKILRFFFQTGPNRTKFATKFFRSEMTPPLFDVFPKNHDQNWRF